MVPCAIVGMPLSIHTVPVPYDREVRQMCQRTCWMEKAPSTLGTTLRGRTANRLPSATERRGGFTTTKGDASGLTLVAVGLVTSTQLRVPAGRVGTVTVTLLSLKTWKLADRGFARANGPVVPVGQVPS